MKRKLLAIIFILLAACSSFLIFHDSIGEEAMEPNGTTIEEDKEEDEEKFGKESTSATLLATGDIMFHQPQIDAAYDDINETYDFTNNFKYVKKYIQAADLSIGNFETVVAGDGTGFSGFPMFNSPEETLVAIKDAGFDILSTVNNHSLDQGKEGLINTISVVEKYGIKNVGTYKEPGNSILIERVNDIDIAILAYSYGYNGMEHTLSDEEQSYMVNTIDQDRIKGDIEKAVDLNADMVVVLMHWGDEYKREPSESQVELARNMVGWGANIILGSHPHVVQGTEIIQHNGRENFIIYSMGNFLSNQREEILNNKYTEDGIMVEIEIEKKQFEQGAIIKDINYIPTWVRKYQENQEVKYEILPVEEFLLNDKLGAQMDQNTKGRIKESYKDTMDRVK